MTAQNVLNVFLLIAVSSLFLGCVDSATDGDFSKIKLDMSEAEVTAILGQPTKSMSHPQFPELRMLEWDGDSRVVLQNGKVDSVVLHDETILSKREPMNTEDLDKLAEEEIKGSTAAEARAWLAVPGNAIFAGSKTEVTALTESFYKAGCPKVYVTGIENFGGTAVSASMVVELPTEPAQRAAAFKVENEFSQKQGEEGEQDKGQKYFMLSFD
ncbi:MAG: hypothetical protein WD669_10165 [Pirellulales bacterium]